MNKNNVADKDFNSKFGLIIFSVLIVILIMAVGRNWLLNLGVIHIERFAYAFMLAMIGAVLAYKGFNAPKRKKHGLEFKILNEQTSLNYLKNKGKEGEDLVNNVISELRRNMDFISTTKTWMPSDDGVADIVIANDRDKFSKEIDLLLVTHGMVFVIEVKNWKGAISFKDGVSYVDGIANGKQSPEKQTKSKVEVFNRLLNYQETKEGRKHENIGHAQILPIYVFSHPQAKLDPNLSHNYITLAALPSLLSYYRDHLPQSSSTNLKFISSEISNMLDKSLDAKDKHMLRLADGNNPDQNILEFKRLYDSIVKNKIALESIDNSFTARATNIFFISGIVLTVPFFFLITVLMIYLQNKV